MRTLEQNNKLATLYSEIIEKLKIILHTKIFRLISDSNQLLIQYIRNEKLI